MRSLRTRLLLGTTVGAAVVLAVAGGLLHALLRQALIDEFDAALVTRVRSLATLAERDGDRLEFELAEIAVPEFEPGPNAEYYQLWGPDGRSVARSPSLRTADLIPPTKSSPEVTLTTITLPDGRPGRAVTLTFVPRSETPALSSAQAQPATLVLASTTAPLQATLTQVRWLLIVVCAVTLGLTLGVMTLVVEKGLKPVRALSTNIARIGADDLSTRVNTGHQPPELSPIASCLNELLARLEVAFKRERRFTGDVAHELRTPPSPVCDPRSNWPCHASARRLTTRNCWATAWASI